jgi:hypothetical protein
MIDQNKLFQVLILRSYQTLCAPENEKIKPGLEALRIIGLAKLITDTVLDTIDRTKWGASDENWGRETIDSIAVAMASLSLLVATYKTKEEMLLFNKKTIERIDKTSILIEQFFSELMETEND